jgi:hypothetical protein
LGSTKKQKLVAQKGVEPLLDKELLFGSSAYTNSNMPASKKMVLREGFEPSAFSSRVSDFKSEMSQPIASPKHKNVSNILIPNNPMWQTEIIVII